MALKTIQDSTLTEIANAIRAKTGNAESLTPLQMPTEIEGIEGGGTGGSDLDALIEGSLTTVYSEVRNMVGSVFYGYAPLATLNLPYAENIGNTACRACTNLSSVSAPLAKTLDSYVFYGCSALVSVVFQSAEKIDAYCFAGCANLETVDLPRAVTLNNRAFLNCAKLASLIIRASTQCILTAIQVLENTPIAKSTGYIYVPAALIEDYKVATNWATFASQFRAIEDYPEITGGAG